MADPARAYAETPYPTGLCLPGHPDLLAACARLHGLEPADPDGCRYLDLACGDGTNALAVADSLPGSECLGIDIASSAIERGESLRRELGLGNAELRAADLLEAEVEPASWDYVVIHGLLSWVPEPVRRSTLALASRAVAPGGVVMASYSALPGWWMLRPARALARRHAAGAGPDPADRAAAARAAVRRASEIDDTGEAYAAMMDEAVERYESMTDSVLCHDDLAELCEPLHLREVTSLAAETGLGYVGEALPDHWWRHALSDERALRVLNATAETGLDRQGEADAIFGHVFKATLLAPGGADAATGPDPRHAGDLHLVSIAEGDEPGDEEPAELRAAAEALTDAAPLGLPVAELGRRAGLSDEAAAQTALRLCAREYAWPSAAPPRFGYPAPERPLVPALGRIVAARTGQLPTLGWDTMELETRIQAALISLLDGTRDRDELAAALREREEELGIEGMPEEGLRAAVETHLEELAGMGGLAPG